jgi:hypothetical protein
MRSILRIVLTVIMDALLVFAAFVLARVVILFFGQLSAVPAANQIAHLTDHFLLPLTFTNITTPYHGTFDVLASVTLVAALVVEWIVGVVRRSVGR